MINKVVLVLVDGLKFQTAVDEMSFLEGLVSEGHARRWKMQARMPSLSRPMYETIHTGVESDEHGIVRNDITRKSICDHIFSVVRSHGGKTAAAAVSWIHELYIGPVDPAQDQDQNDPDAFIQYGRFYLEDQYPSSSLFNDARHLTDEYEPDYLLVHPMDLDDKGHNFGGASAEYAQAAKEVDGQLAQMIPYWINRGYKIIVTSDHGMDDQGNHGNDTDIERMVPFYLMDETDGGVQEGLASQLSVMPTVLKLMGVSIPAAAKSPPLT